MTSVDVIEPAGQEERRTSYLELFFDLVFVFAITQVVTLILEDSSPRGFGRAALVLALVWWAWSGYAWMTNAIDIEGLSVRLLFLLGTGGVFFMALAVPDAYRDEGLWFAAPYFFVRVLNLALYLWGLRSSREHFNALLRLAPFFLVAPTVALSGGLVQGSLRSALWIAALAIDVIGTLSLGRENDFRVSPAHFAERYALFVIIALGESVVAIGVGAAELERDILFALSVGVAAAGAAALWWAYFDFVSRAVERSLRAAPSRQRGPLARDVFTIFHYPIVLGVILYAVAAKQTLAHPEEPLSRPGRWALALGIVLFLAGFVLGRFRAIRRVAWERVAGALASVVAVVALRGTDAIGLLTVVIVILVATLAVETSDCAMCARN